MKEIQVNKFELNEFGAVVINYVEDKTEKTEPYSLHKIAALQGYSITDNKITFNVGENELKMTVTDWFNNHFSKKNCNENLAEFLIEWKQRISKIHHPDAFKIPFSM